MGYKIDMIEELRDEIAYLKRLLNEDPKKPTYKCRNQVAMVYHQQIDDLTRQLGRK